MPLTATASKKGNGAAVVADDDVVAVGIVALAP